MPPVRVTRIVKQEIEVEGLGKRLKAARDRDHRPLTVLAREVGISRNYWYQLEAEKVMGGMSESTLRKIETVLGVDFGIVFPEQDGEIIDG